MIKSSKWISAVAVLALSASLAMAAPERNGEGWQGRRGHGQRIAEKLNLSDEQRQQSQQIRKESREQNASFLESFHQNMKDFRDARRAGDRAKMDSLEPTLRTQREQMKELRQARQEKFLSILTPEQRTEFDRLKAEREARHRGRQGNGH